MSTVSTITVEATTEKSGVSQKTGKPWKKYALKDANGEWYGTFENGVVHDAMKGQKYEIEWEQDGNFKNLLRATPTSDSPVSSRLETGEADWDLIGLRKTRCALWAALLPDALTLAYTQWAAVQSDPPGTLDIKNFVTRFCRELVISAEIDIFSRDPALPDEDVPF
jgi:hypothetical protein